jgi:DNA-binding transcriptional LysR family regulator
MELRHLRSFVAVAEESSFSRAALRLPIAQPPLSRRIVELEEELNLKLFNRSTRCVSLTEAGETYLEHIRPLLDGLDRAAEAARRAERGETGKLRLGYTGRASQEHLPGLLNRFRRTFPDVNLDIRGPSPSGTLRLELLERRLDAILCFLPISDPGINSQVFTESEFSIALPISHRYARSQQLALEELRHEPFVAYPSGPLFHLRQAMDQICMDAGFVPHVVRESEASQTLLCLIAAGVGIGIIPQETRALAVEGVVFKPLPQTARRVQHGLAWLRDNSNPVLGKLLSIAQEMQSI